MRLKPSMMDLGRGSPRLACRTPVKAQLKFQTLWKINKLAAIMHCP
jgi:hypothetical protein